VLAESTTGADALVMADLDGSFLEKARAEWIGHYRALADGRPELYDA
jgi:hypothetical protein